MQAQQSTEPPANGVAKEFRASVLDLSGKSQHITVPINRSVTLETTVATARADVIARHIADVQVVSPTRILVTGQNFGTTSVIFFGADDKQYVFDVTVELDLEQYNQALRGIDPQSTAKAVSMRGNIVLMGVVTSAERAQRMVELAELYLPRAAQGELIVKVQNHLEITGEQQVLLRCVVAEVSRSAARDLGVNGFLAGENFRDAFMVNQLGAINPINIGAAAAFPVTQNVPFVTGENGIPISPATTLSLGFPRVQMQLFLKAMADNTLLHILAEPNLVAISGETATFLAGGEFPIPVPQGQSQTITIEYREFGVRLNFTPIVRGQERIRLRVAPEVSELDFGNAVQISGYVVPGLRTRSTETTIELGSGQTIAIAGLLSEEVRGLASRIPGVGDLPVLGTLFRSVSYRRSHTELVVLVTPEIVAPLEANQRVRLPGEAIENPNDLDLYIMGMLEAPPDCKGRCHPGAADKVVEPEDPNNLSIHGPWGSERNIEVR